jgi:hypothetical protein
MKVLDRDDDRVVSDYDFDQMFAEAVCRIGIDPVERYLTDAARRLGWPIPRRERARVIDGLVMLTVRTENAFH